MSDDEDFSQESLQEVNYEEPEQGFNINFGDGYQNPYSNMCQGCHGTRFIKSNGTLVCANCNREN